MFSTFVVSLRRGCEATSGPSQAVQVSVQSLGKIKFNTYTLIERLESRRALKVLQFSGACRYRANNSMWMIACMSDTED